MSESIATTSMVLSNHRLEIALGDCKTVDVFFVFTNDHRCTRIASHKVILSSKSDVFLTMFSDKWKDDEINITDATAEHFSHFLQTFYDDKNIAKNISIKNVDKILYLAHKYNAEHCVEACQKVLYSMLTGRNKFYVMELALLYGIEELIDECAFEISSEYYDILETEEFYKCSPRVLKCFLENIDVADFCSSAAGFPYEICRACMQWAKIRCSEQNIDVKKPENLRSQFNDFFEKIPFNYMEPNDIVDFLADYADVFTFNEIKAMCKRQC